MEKIEHILSRISDFPTLPTIYSSLLDLTSNPRTTVQDVANLISKDQASVVKILKIVNSAVFGLQTKVDTISQAIFYLGFNEVKNIVLAISVMNIFNKGVSSKEFNIVDLWKHSIAVGVITRLLGLKLGIKNVENFFVSGIVHDIGKLFLASFYREKYGELVKIAKEKNIKLTELEINEFGLNHDQIGRELAITWKLPESIVNAIRYHNLGLVNGKPETLVSCVHIANIITQIMRLGNPGYFTVQQPNFLIWNYLNIAPGSFKEMFDVIVSSYKHSESILSLK